MSLEALLLVLIAALAHACWNFLAKKCEGGIPFVWLVYLFSSLIFLPAILWSGFTKGFSFAYPLAALAIVSGALRLFCFIILQRGYQQADLSVVYPLARGTAPLLSGMGGVLFFDESLTVSSFTGLLTISAGVVIIANPTLRKKDQKLKAGILYGLTAGLLVALYTLWDKLAINREVSPLSLTFTSGVLGAMVLSPIAFSRKEETANAIKNHLWPIVAISLLSPLSYILVLVAMKTTPVIYVAPLREVSILFGVLMGGGLMAEKNPIRRSVASVLILSGILLLALS
jgi:drug/metabolite transporter (DMT)-like permease